MLTKDERILFEKVIEALNRLFDRESTVTDLHAILFAVGKAFDKDRFRSIFESPIEELEKTIRSEASEEQKRDFALDATDDLRKFVGEELRRDAKANPKRRHALAEVRSLEQVLASTSEFLFPAECGEQPVNIHSRASDGDTALHVLVVQNDLEGAKMLLAAGADINAAGDMGYTPLHEAVAQNNVAMAQLLLQAGARSDLKTELCGMAREEALRKAGEMATLFAEFRQ